MGKKQIKRKLPGDITARLDEAVEAFRKETSREMIKDQEVVQELFDHYTAQLTGYEDHLILALAKIRHPKILQFLYDRSQGESDKKSRKALRKAIYSLEQSGLLVEERDRAPKESLIKPPAALAPLGYLSGFEPFQGLRSGMLALPATRGRYDTALFLCSQAGGLIQFGGGLLTETQLHKSLPNMGAWSNTGMMEVSPRAVRFVLSEARLRSRRKGLPFDEEAYEGFMAQAGRKVPLPDRAVIYEHVSPEGLLDRVDIQTVPSKLFDHPFFDGLRAGEDILPYLAKLNQTQTSVLVLSEAQQNERRMGIIEEAVRELFTPEKKQRLKRQLEEIAYLLFLSDETDLAEAALAVALDLAEKNTWSDHPFIRLFMLISIDFFAQGDHHPQSMPHGQETTLSPSGLILPGALEPEPTETGIIAPGMNEDER